MSHIDFLSLSWRKLHDDVFSLSQKVKKSQLEFDRIVAISRGGLVTARMLSDFLQIKISTFTMVAYQKITQLGHPEIMEGLKANIMGEKVLLVDEIADSGQSFKLGVEYLESLSPAQITTLAPYIKSQTEFEPDFWEVQTDRWIIFPYEVRETIQDIAQLMKQQGKTLEQVRTKLQNLGFNQEQLAVFL